MNRLVLLVALVSLAPLAFAKGESLHARNASTEQSVSKTWMHHCKGCHGADGRAQTRMGRKHHMPDFTSAKFQKSRTDAHLLDVITHGSKVDSKMKGYGNRLSKEEIQALVHYIRALGRGAK